MEKLEDYSQHFGILDKWSKEKFESELAIYKKERERHYKNVRYLQDYLLSLDKNIEWFDRKLKEFYFKELKENFVLKQEHKIILNYLEFEIDGNHLHSNMYYLQENYLEVVFKLNKYLLSDKQQDEYSKIFDKLIDELPLAIKELLKS